MQERKKERKEKEGVNRINWQNGTACLYNNNNNNNNNSNNSNNVFLNKWMN